MSTTERRSRPTLRDVIVLVAAFAVSWSLPRTITLTKANFQQFWHQGFWDILLWWAILGPTLAGPVLVWLHRRESRKNISGASLWFALGTLKVIQIGLFYAFFPASFGAGILYTEMFAEITVPAALAVCLVGRGWKDRPWLDVPGIILGIAWTVYFSHNFYSRLFSANKAWSCL
jgi:hypothetical protein